MGDSALPIVSVVGKSDTGKTGVVEVLVKTLTGRGWRVATVKHHACGSGGADVPGKDSWRHAQAGAAVSMVSSADSLAVFRRLEREATLDDLAAQAGDVDLLLTEGFKRTGRVRIEVSRDERSTELVCEPGELFAVVSDGRRDAGDVPVFGFDELEALADTIEASFLARSPAGSDVAEERAE
jgi:molybdopterin-guanine dinucleotide biosynthesis protein B